MIDIIITAYNAHETIQKTLLSIEMQTIKELVKIYIIDDASNKNYLYLKEIFQNELDITIIRNTNNLGPGLSRQKGLDNSEQEFIVFIDSDDVFYDAYALETLYNNIGNKDMIIGAMLEERSKNNYLYTAVHKGCLHGKMYRRSVINKYNIKFCDSRNHEDNAFNFLYMNCCNHIAQTDKIIYLYNYNKNSITKKHTDIFKDVHNFIYAYTWLVNESIERNIDPLNIAGFIYYTILYGYSRYTLYHNIIDLSFVFEELAPIKRLYHKYNLLPDNEKMTLFYNFIYNRAIPTMTVDEFINKIKN